MARNAVQLVYHQERKIHSRRASSSELVARDPSRGRNVLENDLVKELCRSHKQGQRAKVLIVRKCDVSGPANIDEHSRISSTASTSGDAFPGLSQASSHRSASRGAGTQLCTPILHSCFSLPCRSDRVVQAIWATWINNRRTTLGLSEDFK
eukprot:376769-Amphidinium_carterae.4